MQDFCAHACHLEHLFVAYFAELARLGAYIGVRGVHPFDIGVYLAHARFERRGKSHRRGIRASAPKRRDVSFVVISLEPGHNHYFTRLQLVEHGLGLYPAYARLAEAPVGHDPCLVTGHGDGFRPHRLNGDAKKSYGRLLPGGEDNVHFAGVRTRADLFCQLDQPVGFTGAGGEDHNELVARFFPGQHPPGDGIDSFGVCDRSPAVLLHNKSHQLETLRGDRFAVNSGSLRK